MHLTQKKRQWLYALQRPWPLEQYPLKTLAEQLQTTVAELSDFVVWLREQGIVRRIGAVFDARRLGYRSCLFALRASEPFLTLAAQRVCAHSGVTHAYVRGWPQDVRLNGVQASDYAAYPNLWYTLSARSERFEQEAAQLADLCPRAFPAIARYKIDVVFDERTRGRDERTEYTTAAPENRSDEPEVIRATSEERAFVRRYQDDTTTPETPFLGEDLPILRAWQKKGIMRRFALLLRHRKVGFMANGMCCWRVSQESRDDLGRRLAAEPEVTHCYARPSVPEFPFNLYAMVHKTSWEAGMDVFQRLSQVVGVSETSGRIFFSTHEYKKSSMRFFVERECEL